jgi:hypothetical protein
VVAAAYLGKSLNSKFGVSHSPSEGPVVRVGGIDEVRTRRFSRYEMASRRELIDTGSDKRFVRRGKRGRFKESDDQGRSLASDRRKKAKRTVKSGQGDKGDRKRTAKRHKGAKGTKRSSRR